MKSNLGRVLLFRVGPKDAEAISKALLPFKVRVQTISPQQESLPLGTLAGLAEDIPVPESANGELTESMMVLCFFSSKELDQILLALRDPSLPKISLKAVLTEHNKFFSPFTLLTELSKEREAFRRQREENPQDGRPRDGSPRDGSPRFRG